jgi:hypothetical protein
VASGQLSIGGRPEPRLVISDVDACVRVVDPEAGLILHHLCERREEAKLEVPSIVCFEPSSGLPRPCVAVCDHPGVAKVRLRTLPMLEAEKPSLVMGKNRLAKRVCVNPWQPDHTPSWLWYRGDYLSS